MRILRSLGSLAAMAGFAVIAVVLLWSDRVGGAPAVGGRLLVRVGRRAESSLGIDLVDRSDIPVAFDQLGHMVLWFTGMVLFGWVARRVVPLSVTALLVAVASLLSEAGQGWASTTREVSAGDAVANLAGVASGFVALSAVLSVQLVAARLGSGRHRGST